MNEKSIKPTFTGEIQFAGYSDSSRSGPRVTFRLTERDELATFVGCEGKRFMAVLVEIMDDETPNTQAAANDAPKAAKDRMAPLCEWAVMRCQEESFQRWCFEWCQTHMGPLELNDLAKKAGPGGQNFARAVLLKICGVESRKTLDTDKEAGSRLHIAIRKPYSEWLRLQEVAA